MSVIPTAEETGWSVRNRWPVFNLAMVTERKPLERRATGCQHFDSERHRADLSAVAFRPGLRGVRRLVHHPLDPLGLAGRSREAGSLRCHRRGNVPGGRSGDDVLAEVPMADTWPLDGGAPDLPVTAERGLMIRRLTPP